MLKCIKKLIYCIFKKEKYPDISGEIKASGATIDVENDKNAKSYYVDDDLNLIKKTSTRK